MAVRVLSAILFSPRGGSAHVARALARGLRKLDFSVTLLSGSRSGGGAGDAERFYGAGCVRAVDFGPALTCGDPLRFEGPPGTAPLHPSYEDRPGAPDRVFAVLDDDDYERQVRAWARELERAGAADADILHLHHLTPINEAAKRVAPGVPVVGHLHGTELLMLEQIAAGPPPGWSHTERWAERMRTWARRCARVVVAPAGIERAVDQLGLERGRIVPLPNGADTERFRPRHVDRARFWRHALVEDPQGWLPGQGPGSARYGEDEAARLAGGTVLLYVGRFTEVKRVDRLIAAFGRARERLDEPAGLVLVGGHPGEWEGEHPAETAARLGVADVFLAGWHAQPELPCFFGAADVVAISSRREQFGQVVVEGMACGLPVVAVRSLGPASIVEDGRTGWLVAPDDEAALAGALVDALGDPIERRRRGTRARQAAVERFSWSSIAAQLGTVLAEVVGTARNGRDTLRAEGYAASGESPTRRKAMTGTSDSSAIGSTSEFVRGVDFVSIPTHDLAAAADFYGETLGLPRSVYLPERNYSEFETGNLTLSVYDPEKMGMRHERNPNPVALHVDDVAATRKLLEDRGVAFHGDILDTGVCHMAFLSDPDGNALMLHCRYAPRQTDI